MNGGDISALLQALSGGVLLHAGLPLVATRKVFWVRLARRILALVLASLFIWMGLAGMCAFMGSLGWLCVLFLAFFVDSSAESRGRRGLPGRNWDLSPFAGFGIEALRFAICAGVVFCAGMWGSIFGEGLARRHLPRSWSGYRAVLPLVIAAILLGLLGLIGYGNHRRPPPGSR
jgi:hypothetical protein